MGASTHCLKVMSPLPLAAGGRLLCILALGGFSLSISSAAPLVLESGQKKISLLELYTSEGCSSCPPTEAWLSGLAKDPLLWKECVPVSFHVDYWNSLGWPDPYSEPKFTSRQRAYAAEWGSENIYTPEFVLNGKEWHPGDGSLSSSAEVGGRLHATIDSSRMVTISFMPGGDSTLKEPLVVEAALLGKAIQSDVPRGENAGRTLRHDFVALALMKSDLSRSSIGEYHGTLVLPSQTISPDPHADLGIALWVRSRDSLIPIQAVGGWFQ